MLKYQPVDEVLRAMGDPTRRDLVERLSGGPATVSQLASPLDMSLSAVVQHLAVLESCGIVRSEKVGRTRTCRLEPVGLRLAEDWFAGQRALWERRLDRLGKALGDDLAAEQTSLHPREELEMTSRTTEHGTFTVTRTYPVPPERVFAAWSNQEAKARWFGAPGHQLDFRVGGTEINRGGPPGGPVYTYDATYRDIVPDERIVYGYTMATDDTLISVSVTTVEFNPAPSGTMLTFTEQGVFLDGGDTPAIREKGTGELLDALGATL
jgi:uncharacterized protein YndB with AHSA1/START domain/DNA-binding transcriptional ArsR family regulator